MAFVHQPFQNKVIALLSIRVDIEVAITMDIMLDNIVVTTLVASEVGNLVAFIFDNFTDNLKAFNHNLLVHHHTEDLAYINPIIQNAIYAFLQTTISTSLNLQISRTYHVLTSIYHPNPLNFLLRRSF